jgi:hypothetical protein
MKIRLGLGAALLASLCVLACSPGLALAAPPEAPEAKPATAVGYTTATLSGVLSPIAAGEAGEYEFLYNTTGTCKEGGASEAGIALGVKQEAVSANISGLAPNTQYTFCLLERNAEGEAISSEPYLSFTTKAVVAPTVTIASVTDRTGTTAHLSGAVDPNGADPAFSTAWHFQCNPECPGLAGGEVAAGNVAEEVSAEATGLLANTAYEVMLVASNLGGESSAGPESFDTLVAPPIVDSAFATQVTSETAQLNAQIDPNGSDTHYYFQYGQQADAYTISVPASPGGDLGAGHGPQIVDVAARDLAASTTYHYRVVAENTSHEQTASEDHAFTTSPTGSSLTLLDGRGWEMVSPLDKNGADINGIDSLLGLSAGGVVQAAENGEGITYTSPGAFSNPKGAPLIGQYLSTREPSGWNVEDITQPLASKSLPSVDNGSPYTAFSSDLSLGLIDTWTGATPYTPSPPLTPDAPPTTRFYLRKSTGQIAPILFGSKALEFQGATPSLNHAVFKTIGGAEQPDLYESTGEQLTPVNILPGETQPTPGAVLGANRAGNPGGSHAISDDGSRVYFSDGGLPGDLYVRENLNTPHPETIDIGGLSFATASSDGSVAFAFGAEDLYRFDLRSASLTDITTADPAGAGVQGVLGASSDGSYVYFVANGDLAPGAPSPRGECASGNGGIESDHCYLYLWHEGITRYIATLSENDNLGSKYGLEDADNATDWAVLLKDSGARVSADGQDVVFMSDGRLTGYDNTDASTGTADQEVYLYDAAGSGALTCVSCNPNGSRPQGPSSIPAGTQYNLFNATYQSRVLTTEGEHARVFFDSSDSLVPQDTDGQQDVYEWEQGGIGSCEQPDGCVGLISGGTGSSRSEFVDASANGDDVFFTTGAQLVPADDDELVDLYDARSPHVPGEQVTFSGPPSSQACAGTGCQGVPPTPPIFATPSSATFNGAGNLARLAPAPAVKPKAPTRAQKLARALRACHSKRGKKRTACESQARRKYGPVKKRSTKQRRR